MADVENNLKVTMVNMDIMLGLPEETILIPDSASLGEPGAVKTIMEYEQLAMQNRKDMQAIGYRKQASQVGIQSAKSGYYPSVALTGGYVALDIPNFITVTNAFTFGVGLSYNVSSLMENERPCYRSKSQAR